eukprot:8610-Eustigmatos_ZCMA.PRE.1
MVGAKCDNCGGTELLCMEHSLPLEPLPGGAHCAPPPGGAPPCPPMEGININHYCTSNTLHLVPTYLVELLLSVE